MSSTYSYIVRVCLWICPSKISHDCVLLARRRRRNDGRFTVVDASTYAGEPAPNTSRFGHYSDRISSRDLHALNLYVPDNACLQPIYTRACIHSISDVKFNWSPCQHGFHSLYIYILKHSKVVRYQWQRKLRIEENVRAFHTQTPNLMHCYRQMCKKECSTYIIGYLI